MCDQEHVATSYILLPSLVQFPFTGPAQEIACILAYLHLCIGPARDFNHHVADRAILRGGVERDVMERRDALILIILYNTIENQKSSS